MCRLQHPVLSSKTRRTDGSDVRRCKWARTSARCPFRVPFSLVSFIRRLRMKNLRPSGGRMNRQTPAKPSFGMEPTWGQVHCQDRGECRGQRRRGRFLLLAVVRRTAAGEWPGIHRRSRHSPIHNLVQLSSRKILLQFLATFEILPITANFLMSR